MLRMAWIILVLMSGGCSPDQNDRAEDVEPAAEIEGQVFVIQKNRLNVKLGGVEVYFVPQSEFRSAATTLGRLREQAKYLRAYRSKFRALEDTINASRRLDGGGSLSEFLRGMDVWIVDAKRRLDQNPRAQELQRVEDSVEDFSEVFINSSFAGAETSQWALAWLFYDWLGRAHTHSAETDADGEFSVILPADFKGFACAIASRQFGGDKSENYFWIQEVSADSSGKVFLTSNTLLEPVVLESMISAAAPIPRSSERLVTDEFDLPDLSWFGKAEVLLRDVRLNINQIRGWESRIADLQSKIAEVRDMSEP